MRIFAVLSLLAILTLGSACGDGGSSGVLSSDWAAPGTAGPGGGSGGSDGIGSPGSPGSAITLARLTLVFDYTAVTEGVRLRMPSPVTQARVEVYDTTTGRIVHRESVEREGASTRQEVVLDRLAHGVKLVRTILMDAGGTVLGYNDQVVNIRGNSNAALLVTVMLAGNPPPPSFELGMPGEAVRLGFLVHPEIHSLGQPFTVEVVALDANGHRVTNAHGPVTLQGGGMNPITVQFINGVAVFSDLTVPSAGSGVVLSVTSGDLIPAESLAFQVTSTTGPGSPGEPGPPGPSPEPTPGPGPTPGPTPSPSPTPPSGGGGTPPGPPPGPRATSLRFVTVPTDTLTAGEEFEVQVEVRDQFGNRLIDGTQSLTLSLQTSPDMAVLGGQATVPAVDGLATFTITLDKTGSYKLSAASAGLLGATSDNLHVQAGAANKLGFFVQPSGATAGVDLTPAPQVELQDAFGNRVATAPAASITLALQSNPTSANLSGSLTQDTAVAPDPEAGVAGFSGLRLDRAGEFTLSASAPGLTGITSDSFTVVAATANQMVFSPPPPASLTAGVLASASTVVEVRDAFGQRAFDFAGDVTLSIDNFTAAPGVGKGSPRLTDDNSTVTVTAVQGQATFTTLQPNLAGDYTIVATTAGITTSPSATFSVVPGAPASLTFTEEPGESTYTGILSRVEVIAHDALGNLATNSAASVSMSASGGKGSLTGTLPVALASGLAAFTDLKIGPGPGPTSAYYRLTASLNAVSTVGTEFLVQQMAEFYVDGGSVDNQPQNVAIDANGNFAVVYTNYPQTQVRRYNADGVPRAENPHIIFENRPNPALAMASDGSFVITWRKSASEICMQRFNSDGVAQGDVVQVNDTTLTFNHDPSVAMDNDGNFVVAWAGYSIGARQLIYARRYSSDGEVLSAQFHVNTNTPPNNFTDNYYTAIGMNSSGAYVVAWSQADGTNFGVFAQRYNSVGSPQGPTFRVSAEKISETPTQNYYPSVAVDTTGGFLVAWTRTIGTGHDGADHDICVQRYQANGVPEGTPFTANPALIDNRDYPSIALDSAGNLLVAWHEFKSDRFRAYARRFTSAGIAQGDPFQIHGHTGHNSSPSVAMNGSGSAVIVWDGTNYGPTGAAGVSGVHARRYPVTTP